MDQVEFTKMLREMLEENVLIAEVRPTHLPGEEPGLIVEDTAGRRYLIQVEEMGL